MRRGIGDLLRHNRTIETLRLYSIPRHSTQQAIAEAIRDCPRRRSLSLHFSQEVSARRSIFGTLKRSNLVALPLA